MFNFNQPPRFPSFFLFLRSFTFCSLARQLARFPLNSRTG